MKEFGMIERLLKILVFSLVLILPGLAHGQAKRFKDVEQAVKIAPDLGGLVVVLLHGSQWNPVGEQFKSKIFDQDSFVKALPSDVCVTSFNVPEEPLEKKSKAWQPGVSVRTYPSLLILDGMGRPIQKIEPLLQIGNAAELAKVISDWAEKIKLRDEKLAKAGAASGVDRTRLLGEGIRDGGCGLGLWLNEQRKPALHELLAAMKEGDPQDSSGWVFATEFPVEKKAAEIGKLKTEKGLAAADAELDRLLGNAYLLPPQRQELQRRRFLMYKEDKQPLEKQIEILKQVAVEAPESILGRGAVKWADELSKKK